MASIALPPGIFRRSLVADARDGIVRAALEDNYHHFELSIRLDAGRIGAIQGRGVRTPWDLCPAAAGQLQQLIGIRIGTDVYRRKELPDPRQHCTHLYELALFASAQAARGGCRRYDMEVPDRIGRRNLPSQLVDGTIVTESPLIDGRTTALLRLDGSPSLAWEIEDEAIVSPLSFAGQNLRKLPAWAEQQFDDDMLESVRLLRRAVHISGGRIVPLDLISRADQHPPQLGGCFVFQSHRVAAARRVKGSTFEFEGAARLPEFPSSEGSTRLARNSPPL